MKKFIAVVAVVIAMATLLTACGKFTCDVCEKESDCNKYKHEIAGEKVVLCESCEALYELAQSLGAGL